jgi:GNAT superfamily N-acetyltransferase
MCDCNKNISKASNPPSKFEGGGCVSCDLNHFDISKLDNYETMLYNDYIKHSSKEEALQLLINSVEGDYSQLSPKLAEIAEKYYGDVEYANGGIVLNSGDEFYNDYYGATYKFNFNEYKGIKYFAGDAYFYTNSSSDDKKTIDEDDFNLIDFENAFDERELDLFLNRISKSLLNVDVSRYTHIANESDYQRQLLENEFNKTIILRQIFDFDKVIGMSDDYEINASFLKDNKEVFTLVGKYDEYNNDGMNMPTIINYIGGKKYVFDYHPFGSMGGLDEHKFIDEVLKSKTKVKPVFSSVIGYEGYALGEDIRLSDSHEEAEEQLEDMKGNLSYHVVEGRQVENKLIGKTWDDDSDEFANGGGVADGVHKVKALLKKEKIDSDAVSPNFVNDFAHKHGITNLTSEQVIEISDTYANGGGVGSFAFQVVIDGDYDESKKFRNFNVAKNYIIGNYSKYETMELLDEKGDSIYVSKDDSLEDVKSLFEFKNGGSVDSDYSGSYYDLRNFIEDNDLQQKFVELANIGSTDSKKINVDEWEDYVSGELGTDEEVIQDLIGKNYKIFYNEEDDEFIITKKKTDKLDYRIIISNKKYNNKVIKVIEDSGVYTEYKPRFVVLIGDKVIGGSTYKIDEDNVYRFDLGILDKYQGYGISKELISKIISDAEELRAVEVNAYVVNDMLFQYFKSIKFNISIDDGQKYAWKTIRKKKKYAKGGGVGNIESEINELYSKFNFINDDFNWKMKLLEMLQDRSIEAYNIYQSLSEIQKEEVLQELFELDNDMGSYGDGELSTSKENLDILLEDAKNGNKLPYSNGGGIGKAMENLHSKASKGTTERGKNKFKFPVELYAISVPEYEYKFNGSAIGKYIDTGVNNPNTGKNMVYYVLQIAPKDELIELRPLGYRSGISTKFEYVKDFGYTELVNDKDKYANGGGVGESIIVKPIYSSQSDKTNRLEYNELIEYLDNFCFVYEKINWSLNDMELPYVKINTGNRKCESSITFADLKLWLSLKGWDWSYSDEYDNGGGVGEYRVKAYTFNDDISPSFEGRVFAKNDTEAENKIGELFSKNDFYQIIKVYRGDVSMTFEKGKLKWDKYSNGGGVGCADTCEDKLSIPSKTFSKSSEDLVKDNLFDGEISVEKLRSIIGREPSYPTQIVGSMKLTKCFLKPFYKI